eukprot:gene33834-45319_t
MDFDCFARKHRSEESIKLFESRALGDSVSSAVYLHVLDVIGAISCLSKKSKSKRSELEVAEEKLFWKTLGEISLLHAKEDDANEEENPALSTVLLSFPREKSTDDWLPLHFALSLKTIDLEITQALLTAQPQRAWTPILATNLWWLDYKWTLGGDDDDDDDEDVSAIPTLKPYHLAFMRKEPCPGLIDQLFSFDANFASTGASDHSLPLHFAARYSSSVDVIRQLVNLYPDALKMKNKSGETPLFMIDLSIDPAAPEMLKYLIDAAPETLQMRNNLGNLPLHEFASYNLEDSSNIIATLIDAYPEALDIANNDGELAIELAAQSASTEVFQVIVERTNPNKVNESVMYGAVREGNQRNVEYLHSIKPELLLLKFRGKTPLHVAIDTFGRSGNHGVFIQSVSSLAPEALTMTDNSGNNLLHEYYAGKEFFEIGARSFILSLVYGKRRRRSQQQHK